MDASQEAGEKVKESGEVGTSGEVDQDGGLLM